MNDGEMRPSPADPAIRLRYLDGLDRQIDQLETLRWLLRRLRWLSLLHGLLMVGYYIARGAAIGSTAATVLLLLFDVPIARADWIPPLAWTLLVILLDAVIAPLEARRERLDRAFRRLLATQIGAIVVHPKNAHDCEVCHRYYPKLRPS
jgi:hypothetical protein